jgi:hypothetical protein
LALSSLQAQELLFKQFFAGHTDDLERELQEGKCAIVETTKGQVARIVVVIALKLCNEMGLTLHHLGSVEDGKVKVVCKTPSLRQHVGERFEDAMHRLLDFVKLPPRIHLERKQQAERWENTSYTLPTKFMSTVLEANLEHGELDQFQRCTFLAQPNLISFGEGGAMDKMDSVRNEQDNRGQSAVSDMSTVLSTRMLNNVSRRMSYRMSHDAIKKSYAMELNNQDINFDIYALPSKDGNGLDFFAWLSERQSFVWSSKRGRRTMELHLKQLILETERLTERRWTTGTARSTTGSVEASNAHQGARAPSQVVLPVEMEF